MVLIWNDNLKLLGFRRKSDRYWSCKRRYGLGDAAHLSLFPTPVSVYGSSARRKCPQQLEFAEFHVTFEAPGHNLHFYYHEIRLNEWSPAGHTSSAEIRRLDLEPSKLKDDADNVARNLVDALCGVYHERRSRKRGVRGPRSPT